MLTDDATTDEERKPQAEIQAKRDAIVPWVEEHPTSTDQGRRMGEFESNEQMSKWASRKRLTRVGSIRNGNGRPLNVYCGSWEPKSNNLVHEVWMTEFCMLYPQADFRRGPNVSDFREDATMILDGVVYRCELFTGSQHRQQWQSRLKVYEKGQCEDPILVIVPPGRRKAPDIIARLMEWTNDGNVYFSTLEWLWEDQRNSTFGGKVWYDLDGVWREIGKPDETEAATPEQPNENVGESL